MGFEWLLGRQGDTVQCEICPKACVIGPGERGDCRIRVNLDGTLRAVTYGLPADVALRSITLSTAEILGIDDRQGSLDLGKDATLFVSTGDVMDLRTQKVTHMWIEGRRVDLDNRHRMLARKYAEKIRRAGAQ